MMSIFSTDGSENSSNLVRKFSSHELQISRSGRRAPREPVIVSQLRSSTGSPAGISLVIPIAASSGVRSTACCFP
jgi:hypothetical protein